MSGHVGSPSPGPQTTVKWMALKRPSVRVGSEAARSYPTIP